MINDENLISNGTRESETIFFSQYSLNDFNLELKTVIRELKWNRENMSNIYKAVLKKICEEIVDKYNNVLDCRIHILPENLDKDVEYIFKVFINHIISFEESFFLQILIPAHSF